MTPACLQKEMGFAIPAVIPAIQVHEAKEVFVYRYLAQHNGLTRQFF